MKQRLTQRRLYGERGTGVPQTSSRPDRRRRRKGAALIITLIALLLLFIFGMLSLRLATNNVLTARRQSRLAQSLNLAEAGADMAEAYLRSLSYPPELDEDEYIDYPIDGSEVSLNPGSCGARIYGVEGNSGAWLKSYVIIATGRNRVNGATRQVIVRVRQTSFALYSYFTDQERWSVNGETIWFYARDRVYGPVHTNDQFHISWGHTSADPIFYDTVSSVAESVEWGASGAPVTTQDWRRVLDGGQQALTLGVSRIPLPLSSDIQRNTAWGSDFGFPSSNGIYLPSSGSLLTAGIYIRGDCTIDFSVESSTGNQVITIVRGSTTRTITIDRANNQTRVRRGSTTDYYVGTPNGVIYCTGNITSLEGTLANNYEDGSQILERNAWTVVADVATGKDITITDDLEYRTPPDSTKPPTHNSNLRAATLGLVAEDVALSTGCPNEMNLDAVILAGGENTANGTFYYTGWASQKRNNLNVLGGIIQKRRGPVGTFNPYNNVQVSGYNKNYRYDGRMVDHPPPFFPSTGGYDVLSWQYR